MPEGSVHSILVALRRRAALVILVLAVVILAGAYLAARKQPVYRATSTVIILPGTNPDIAYTDTVKVLLPTIAVQLASRSFLVQDVAPFLPFKISGDDLVKQVTGQLETNGGALDIVGTADNPTEAAELSVAATEAFLRTFASNTSMHLQASNLAAPPPSPSGPGRNFVLAVAAVVGLVLGIGAAIAWERAFPKIRSIEDLEALSDLPVLGQVPPLRSQRTPRPLAPGSPGFARMQMHLRAASLELCFALNKGGLRSVVVANLERGSSAGTVSACLAVLIAELDRRVMLVDTDLKHPTQHLVFGVDNDRGFFNLTEDPRAAGIFRPTTFPGLALVTTGWAETGQRQEEGLYRHLMSAIPEADVVLLDSSPLGPSPETHLLAFSVGAVLMVLEAGRVTPRAFLAMVESLQRVGVQPLGAVVTNARGPRTRRTHPSRPAASSSQSAPLAGHRREALAGGSGTTSPDPNPYAASNGHNGYASEWAPPASTDLLPASTREGMNGEVAAEEPTGGTWARRRPNGPGTERR